MSSLNTYFDTPIGRTMVISLLLAAFMFFFALLIPLAPYDENAWYAFLYMDISLDPSDRMNWGLMFLESVLLILLYLFIIIGLGSYAELNNRLPSWGEVATGGIITLLAALLLPQIPGPETTIEGIGTSGYYHFTSNMQIGVFITTLVGMILVTMYLMYTAPADE
jgi:hypothetical protein